MTWFTAESTSCKLFSISSGSGEGQGRDRLVALGRNRLVALGMNKKLCHIYAVTASGFPGWIWQQPFLGSHHAGDKRLTQLTERQEPIQTF